ncbi:unnamed protein product [Boreogadus saida]
MDIVATPIVGGWDFQRRRSKQGCGSTVHKFFLLWGKKGPSPGLVRLRGRGLNRSRLLPLSPGGKRIAVGDPNALDCPGALDARHRAERHIPPLDYLSAERALFPVLA